MACTGHTNASSCGGHTNSCPAHGGYIAPVTPSTWTDPTITAGLTTVKTDHHNELRTAITNELTRRSNSWPTDPGAVNASSSIEYLHIRRLRDGIDAAKTWTWPSYLADDNTGSDDDIEAQQYTAMRSQVNSIEAECVCDCNYACTCNCNYACTCQCNYACTCNCNYSCTCNCNYACTCNCNYSAKSDIRLKYDIEYL